MSTAHQKSDRSPDLVLYSRDGSGRPESAYEKPMVLPAPNQSDPALHGWADARFAIDIMAEHALFFMLLMPPEVAGAERADALRFHQVFSDLFREIDSTPLQHNEVKRFAQNAIERIKPFIDYKARLGDAQSSGRLRSLVWPLFFDHTRHEAERWIRRLEDLARGESEFERAEVVKFWTNIMDEHARFVAHLLDP